MAMHLDCKCNANLVRISVKEIFPLFDLPFCVARNAMGGGFGM